MKPSAKYNGQLKQEGELLRTGEEAGSCSLLSQEDFESLLSFENIRWDELSNECRDSSTGTKNLVDAEVKPLSVLEGWLLDESADLGDDLIYSSPRML